MSSTQRATSRDRDTGNPKKQAGSWLREQRQKAGLSQMDLANKLGFKYYTFISQIENGYGRVPSQFMADWARALGVRPERFARVCWVTTIQRYIVFCSRMGRHERGLPGSCETGKPSANLNAWTPAETEELTRLYRAKRDLGGAAGFAYGETDQPRSAILCLEQH